MVWLFRWDELVEMWCSVTHIGEVRAMPPALALGVHKSFKGTRGSRTNHLMFGLGWHQPLLKGFCLKSETFASQRFLTWIWLRYHPKLLNPTSLSIYGFHQCSFMGRSESVPMLDEVIFLLNGLAGACAYTSSGGVIAYTQNICR